MTFNECGVSYLQNKNVLELYFPNMGIYLTLLNFKMVKIISFMLCFLFTTIIIRKRYHACFPKSTLDLNADLVYLLLGDIDECIQPSSRVPLSSSVR